MTAKHKHVALPHKTREYPYRGPISIPVKYNDRAHGGICVVEECECGARRSANVSAGHVEQGTWRLAEPHHLKER